MVERLSSFVRFAAVPAVSKLADYLRGENELAASLDAKYFTAERLREPPETDIAPEPANSFPEPSARGVERSGSLDTLSWEAFYKAHKALCKCGYKVEADAIVDLYGGTCYNTEPTLVYVEALLADLKKVGGVQSGNASGNARASLTSQEFNVLAGKYLKENASDKHRVTVRELQKYLKGKNPNGTCSMRTITKLPIWCAYQQRLERAGQKGRKARPRAVPLDEARVGGNDHELLRLIDEQEKEMCEEPSPCIGYEVDSRKHVRYQKRV